MFGELHVGFDEAEEPAGISTGIGHKEIRMSYELDTLAKGLNALPESLRNYAARRLAGPIRTDRIAWGRPPPTLNKHSIAQRFCPILAEPRNAKGCVFTGKRSFM